MTEDELERERMLTAVTSWPGQAGRALKAAVTSMPISANVPAARVLPSTSVTGPELEAPLTAFAAPGESAHVEPVQE